MSVYLEKLAESIGLIQALGETEDEFRERIATQMHIQREARRESGVCPRCTNPMFYCTCERVEP